MDLTPPQHDEEDTAQKRRKTARWLIAALIVAGLHIGLFSLLAVTRPDVLPVDSRVIDVILFRPPPVSPPPPVVEAPSEDAGGGAPAAPSVVRTPPDPPRRPDAPVAPPKPAPEPTLVVGAAPVADPAPGMGQGGQGTGSGGGSGSGAGPGSGGGAVFVRGASNREILALVPPEARRQRVAGRSEVSCVVRADTRLEDCRVVREQPAGFGFGEAAVRVAEGYFRFRPPTDGAGQPVEDFRVIVSVPFGRQSN